MAHGEQSGHDQSTGDQPAGHEQATAPQRIRAKQHQQQQADMQGRKANGQAKRRQLPQQ